MAVILLGGGFPGPETIAGLTGWWSADVGVYSDAGVTLAVDGNTVQQWNDRSTTGAHFTQATAGSRPTFKTNIVSGQPVVRFGGGTDDDEMVNATALSTFFTVSAKTAFFVYKWTANGTVEIMGDTSGLWRSLVLTVSGATQNTFNNDGVLDTASKAASAGSFHIATALHSGGSIYNGTDDTRTASMGSAVSGNTTSLAGTPTMGVAGDLASNQLDGDIAEVVFYNVALSEANRQTVERYLASKYGITLPY